MQIKRRGGDTRADGTEIPPLIKPRTTKPSPPAEPESRDGAPGGAQAITLRLAPELVARADSLVAALAADPVLGAMSPDGPTRSTVLRLAIVYGLDVIAERHDKAGAR